MDYLPLFVRVAGARCVLVGGGEVAHRRLTTLLSAGARVTVIAPTAIDEVRTLCVGDVELVERRFEPNDVVGAMLVVAATDDEAVNRDVHAAAIRNGVLINTVDEGALSTAIFPSIIDRDPVIVAVSTGGRSPTLARRVRTWIEARLPTGYANAAAETVSTTSDRAGASGMRFSTIRRRGRSTRATRRAPIPTSQSVSRIGTQARPGLYRWSERGPAIRRC